MHSAPFWPSHCTTCLTCIILELALSNPSPRHDANVNPERWNLSNGNPSSSHSCYQSYLELTLIWPGRWMPRRCDTSWAVPLAYILSSFLCVCLERLCLLGTFSSSASLSRLWWKVTQLVSGSGNPGRGLERESDRNLPLLEAFLIVPMEKVEKTEAERT